MGIRETINKHRPLAVGATVVAAAGALALSLWSSHNEASPPPLLKAYFSDDDGKSWFVDDSRKLPPFDHNGKPAVRAFVFHCDNGKPYVAYLLRYKDGSQKQIEELRARPPSGENGAQLSSVMAGASECKRPGDARWVSSGSSAGLAIMTPKPPAGESGDPEPVDPS
jgi:hypothetical protein